VKKIISSFVIAFVLSGQVYAQGQTQEEQKSQWAPTANFLIGKFDTRQTSPVLEAIFGFESELSGRSWDLGAVRGRPGHSYIRIAYTEVRLDDGSRAFEDFENNVTKDAKVKGVKFEKVWRLGPSRWPVAPMFSLHGGAGKISGLVHWTAENQFCSPFAPRSQCFFEEDLPARRIFGDLNWLPLGGLSIGATADILDYVTITVSVYGIEFPGTYKGSVQLVYWPWRTRRP